MTLPKEEPAWGGSFPLVGRTAVVFDDWKHYVLLNQRQERRSFQTNDSGGLFGT